MMFAWFKSSREGKRASDHPFPVPAKPRRDRALESAIARNRIEVHFQPQIELATGYVTGVRRLPAGTAPSRPRNVRRAAATGQSERLSLRFQRKALRMVGK